MQNKIEYYLIILLHTYSIHLFSHFVTSLHRICHCYDTEPIQIDKSGRLLFKRICSTNTFGKFIVFSRLNVAVLFFISKYKIIHFILLAVWAHKKFYIVSDWMTFESPYATWKTFSDLYLYNDSTKWTKTILFQLKQYKYCICFAILCDTRTEIKCWSPSKIIQKWQNMQSNESVSKLNAKVKWTDNKTWSVIFVHSSIRALGMATVIQFFQLGWISMQKDSNFQKTCVPKWPT